MFIIPYLRKFSVNFIYLSKFWYSIQWYNGSNNVFVSAISVLEKGLAHYLYAM